MNTSARVIRILREAKRLAREYYNLTRRPLGVTGEVAEPRSRSAPTLEAGTGKTGLFRRHAEDLARRAAVPNKRETNPS